MIRTSLLLPLLAASIECWLPANTLAKEKVTDDHVLECDGFVEMGTEFKVCVFTAKHKISSTNRHFKKAREILSQTNGWMSDWLSTSELSQINDYAGIRPVQVRRELFDIIRQSIEIAKKTEGAFDITFNAFWGLYRFKKGEERAPSDQEIAERLPLVNFRNVELIEDRRSVFLKNPRMKVGLGGIGQGYGVDQIVSYLKKQGYNAGYVDGSGDTFFWGNKPDGSLWTTGIRDPFDHTKIVAMILGTDFAVTTAGDDEKFFFKEGERIHHILDPKTGKPARLSRQATVIASSATVADAYDTASFVLGPTKAIEVLERIGAEGVLVGPDKKTSFTKRLVRKVVPPHGEVYVVGNTD